MPQFYQQIWNNAHIAMCVLDINGNYVDVNKEFCKLCGYSRPELVGATLTSTMVLAGAEHQHEVALHRAFLSGDPSVSSGFGGEASSEELWLLLHKDDYKLTVNVSAVKIHDAQGDVYSLFNVTQASQTLLEAERDQRKLSDAQAAVMATVVSHADIDDVLASILHHVNDLIACDASSIALLQKDIVQVASYRNNHRQQLEASYTTFQAPFVKLKLEQASLEQGALIVADADTDPRLEYDGERGDWIRSFVTIPLRVSTVVLGWLWLDAATPNAFTKASIVRLQPFADAAAIAVRNTQLYQLVKHELQQRTHMQTALQRSERDLRGLIDALPDGFLRLDRQGRYLEARASHVFRPVVSEDAMIGKTFEDILPETVATSMRKSYETLFQTGEMQTYEYRLQIAEEVRYREARWVKLNDNESLGVIRDITEQKLAEEKLQQRESLFRSLFEHSSLGIALIDIQGLFTDVNHAFCMLLGYNKADLLGRSPVDITHPDDAILTLPFADKTSYQIEKRFISSTGEIIWTLVNATKIPQMVSRPAYIIKHVQDISEQKRLDQALQSSQARLESVVTTMPDLVMTLAADNTVIFSSAQQDDHVSSDTQFQDKLGYYAPQQQVGDQLSSYAENLVATSEITSAAVTSLDDAAVLPAGQALASASLSRNRVYAHLGHLGRSLVEALPVNQQQTFAVTLEHVRQYGSEARLELCFSVNTLNTLLAVPQQAAIELWFLTRIQRSDAINGELVVVMTDMSESKHSTIQLERAFVERTTLLKEIHHRVKNNMQVISSLLHLRSRGLPQGDQGDIAKRALSDSRERIRAMALVHEVMYETEHFNAIDFHVYLDNLLNIVMRANRTQDIALRLELNPVVLHIDQAIPCGLIANELMSNALKHAFPENGLVQQHAHEAEQRYICVQLLTHAEQVTLRVRDNGMGMQPATKDSLGMTIVESLAAQLLGTVRFNNVAPPQRGFIAELHFTPLTVDAIPDPVQHNID
ncbi:MAG: PAS domain S-box protein [Deinococcota bacterium]